MLLITHNLGIVGQACDRVAVMYAGRIVEQGRVDEIFADPKHPYTQELLRATISLETTELRTIPGAPPDLSIRRPAAGSIRAARTRWPCASTSSAATDVLIGGRAAECHLLHLDSLSTAQRRPLAHEEVLVADEA